jgi:hypothetical protein
MGRKSRLKWEHRRRPLPAIDEPLETRWGKHPLARAFGEMLQGLMLGLFAALFCLALGLARIAVSAWNPDTEGLASEIARYAGGFLLGGAVAGALAPVRTWIGGRRAQGSVMAAIAVATWMPMIRREADADVAIFAWAVCSVIFGLMFAKLFAILDPDPPRASIRDLDPDFRSGRHRQFRP